MKKVLQIKSNINPSSILSVPNTVKNLKTLILDKSGTEMARVKLEVGKLSELNKES